MTSSTKPETHNVPRRRHGNRQYVCEKFDEVVFEICEWTDRQIYRRTHHNSSHFSEGQSNDVCD